MRYLDELKIGYRVGSIVIPIVPAAILFDLGVGDPKIRPGEQAGYAACQAASSSVPREGNVGAGAGATGWQDVWDESRHEIRHWHGQLPPFDLRFNCRRDRCRKRSRRRAPPRNEQNLSRCPRSGWPKFFGHDGPDACRDYPGQSKSGETRRSESSRPTPRSRKLKPRRSRRWRTMVWRAPSIRFTLPSTATRFLRRPREVRRRARMPARLERSRRRRWRSPPTAPFCTASRASSGLPAHRDLAWLKEAFA